MTMQITTFELAEGADEAGFLRADAALQRELMVNAAGLLRRTTARGDERRWVVVTLWASPADAGAGADVAAGSDAGRAFSRFVDPDTVADSRYEELAG